MRTALIKWIEPGINFYRTKWFYFLAAGLAILSIVAGMAFLWATQPFGIGVRSDSVAYLWSARNLAEGVGLGRLSGTGKLKPMTHWPPFYPVVLSIFEKCGVDALNGARWLGAALFSIILFLVGWILARMTGSFWFSLAGTLVLLVFHGFWDTSLYAMTEPLYTVLSLAGIILFDQFLTNEKRGWMMGAALLMALTFLTRYVGMALILSGGIVLFLRPGWTLGKRLRQSALFCFLAMLPEGLWMARNYLEAGSTTNRTLNVIPIPASDFQLLGETVNRWISPFQTVFNIGTGKLALGLVALVVFFVLYFYNRSRQVENAVSSRHLRVFFMVYAPLYALFILLSRYYFDGLITIFEERITFPFYLSIFILFIFCLSILWSRAQRRSLVLAGGLTLVFVFLGNSFFQVYKNNTTGLISLSRNVGLGYSNARYGKFEIIERLKELPEDYIVYTDNIEKLYFASERFSTQLSDFTTGDAQVLRKELKDGKGIIIVLFYSEQIAQGIEKELPEARLVYQAGSQALYVLEK
jgi:4-amino-4-deoxy-L-arabinose transferase-like glycosyltransferase